MPNVEQMLRSLARQHPEVPYPVLEKDYALSYLLAGIAVVDELKQGLVLKGGTALRKFHFQGYRFSEDLDFSVQPGVRLSAVDKAMARAVQGMENLLQERGPFQVQMKRLLLREPHPRGQDAFVIQVRFPAHPVAQCRVKVEITRDELILQQPQTRQLLHAYPEKLKVSFPCYTLEEIVAEKLRALLQSWQKLRVRGWGASRVCRDYYDIWSIIRQADLQRQIIPELVARKCSHREVDFGVPSDFFSEELLHVAHTEWDRQLRPFVIGCPDSTQVLEELPVLLANLWE